MQEPELFKEELVKKRKTSCDFNYTYKLSESTVILILSKYKNLPSLKIEIATKNWHKYNCFDKISWMFSWPSTENPWNRTIVVKVHLGHICHLYTFITDSDFSKFNLNINVCIDYSVEMGETAKREIKLSVSCIFYSPDDCQRKLVAWIDNRLPYVGIKWHR